MVRQSSTSPSGHPGLGQSFLRFKQSSGQNKPNEQTKPRNQGQLGFPAGGDVGGVKNSHSTWAAFFLASLWQRKEHALCKGPEGWRSPLPLFPQVSATVLRRTPGNSMLAFALESILCPNLTSTGSIQKAETLGISSDQMDKNIIWREEGRIQWTHAEHISMPGPMLMVVRNKIYGARTQIFPQRI